MGKFKNSPLTQFITPAVSTPEPPQPPPQEKQARQKRTKATPALMSAPPAVFRAKDDRETPRNRRVQLLFRPAMFNELLTQAHSRGQSLNNYIEDILTAYLEQQEEK